MRRTQTYMNERAAWIQAYINKNGSIEIGDIVKQFNISPSTARKQLNLMHDRGDIIRIHGGAIGESEVNNKQMPYYKERQAIACAARKLVEDNDIIAIGAGNTTLLFAQTLHDVKGLTVVTDSLPVANELRSDPEIEVHICGGLVRPFNGAVIGPRAESFFREIHVRKAFLGIDSIAAGFHVTSRDVYTSYSERKIMEVSERTYLLADHSKVGVQTGLDKLASLSEIDGLVTDCESDHKALMDLKACGLHVITADPC